MGKVANVSSWSFPELKSAFRDQVGPLWFGQNLILLFLFPRALLATNKKNLVQLAVHRIKTRVEGASLLARK